MERVSPALSPTILDNYQDRDKTVTVRHRETPDRDDEQSESLPVTGWIVVELLQHHHGRKPAYLHLVLYGIKCYRTC